MTASKENSGIRKYNMAGLSFTAWDIFIVVGFISASLAVSIATNKFSGWSFAGGTLSILCVILGAKGHISNFAFGLAGSLILGYIMFRSGLYAMSAFYVLYNAPMQVIGWHQWKNRHTGHITGFVAPRRMGTGQKIIMLGSTLLLIVIVNYVLKNFTEDAQPLNDAVAVSVAIVTQFVLVKAFIEQWFLWIVMDIVMIFVWLVSWSSGVPHAAIQCILEFFYLINAIRGVFLWSKLEKGKNE